MFEQVNQRKEIKLAIGQVAYFICDTYGKPDTVTITGLCEEGNGYIALNPNMVTKDNPTGEIHTCNGILVATKKEARKISVERLKSYRKELVKQQTSIVYGIQYIDWVLSRNGKF